MKLILGAIVLISMSSALGASKISDSAIELEIEGALNEVSQDFFEPEGSVTPSRRDREKIYKQKISLENDGSVVDNEPEVELDLDDDGNIEAHVVIDKSPSKAQLSRSLKVNGTKTMEFTYSTPVWALNSERLKLVGLSPQAENLLSRKPKSSVQRCQVSGHFNKFEVFVLQLKKCKTIMGG